MSIDSAPSPTTAVRSTSILMWADYTNPSRSSHARLTRIRARRSGARTLVLGLGVEPRVVTWGRMLNGGRLYLSTAWWLTAFPGLAIFVTVLAVNLLGDHLRDWLYPRLRNTLGGDQI